MFFFFPFHPPSVVLQQMWHAARIFHLRTNLSLTLENVARMLRDNSKIVVCNWWGTHSSNNHHAVNADALWSENGEYLTEICRLSICLGRRIDFLLVSVLGLTEIIFWTLEKTFKLRQNCHFFSIYNSILKLAATYIKFPRYGFYMKIKFEQTCTINCTLQQKQKYC